MNIFNFNRIAEGYANDRPYYNPLVIDMVRKRTGIHDKIQAAVDVGCGTGLSTRALCEIASTVIGTDSSDEMILTAKKYDKDKITYCCSPAERIPTNDNAVQMITVVGAINWIDCDTFLPEVNRVLSHNGWLIIYDNGITSKVRDVPEYTDWYERDFLTRYPKPPRKENPLTENVLSRHGFELVARDEYENEVVLTAEQYTRFMAIQSNIIQAVELGNEKIDRVSSWILTEILRVLPATSGTFVFGGYVMYIRKSRI